MTPDFCGTNSIIAILQNELEKYLALNSVNFLENILTKLNLRLFFGKKNKLINFVNWRQTILEI